MEALTIIQEIGTELKAWCPGCHSWIDDVDIVYDCHIRTGKKIIKYVDYIYCSECHEGIVRSE